ncbi:MAG: hypothetical protein IJ899_19450 [Blautia sp.]|nr:hypothetical protein [Blautia sp.]
MKNKRIAGGCRIARAAPLPGDSQNQAFVDAAWIHVKNGTDYESDF